jgi:hypothetical protein
VCKNNTESVRGRNLQFAIASPANASIIWTRLSLPRYFFHPPFPLKSAQCPHAGPLAPPPHSETNVLPIPGHKATGSTLKTARKRAKPTLIRGDEDCFDQPYTSTIYVGFHSQCAEAHKLATFSLSFRPRTNKRDKTDKEESKTNACYRSATHPPQSSPSSSHTGRVLRYIRARAGEFGIEVGRRARRMSETCPHIAGSITAEHKPAPIASLNSAVTQCTVRVALLLENDRGQAGKPRRGAGVIQASGRCSARCAEVGAEKGNGGRRAVREIRA